MELTSLRYFVAVAHELNFHRAAVKLHMTQSPLSSAIRKLEDELETRLFDRTNRSVRLTPAGRLFLDEAEAVLNRAELARTRLAELVSAKERKLAVGYNEPVLNTLLPDLLARCRKRYPNLRLELRELETSEQLEYLRRGGLDLGLMRPFGFDLGTLTARLIATESYRLVMPENHPLARKRSIAASDLADAEIILFAREVNPAIYDRLVSSLTADSGNPPRFRQDARNKSSMLAMVKAGFGAALMPESCCGAAASGLTARELAIPLPPVNIMAVWDPSRLTGALDDFIRLLPPRPPEP